MAAVRRALADAASDGGHIPLMVDANHAYTAHVAITMGRAMEQEGVYWFEEPVHPEDLAGYRQVVDALALAVAGGECEHTRYGFRELFARRCVDIAQPDVCCAGGLSEAMKIAALASAFGVQVVPHVWGSGVALAAALHFAAALPPYPASVQRLAAANEPMLEFDQSPNSLRDELLDRPIQLEANGMVLVPHGHGLGITIRKEALHTYAAHT